MDLVSIRGIRAIADIAGCGFDPHSSKARRRSSLEIKVPSINIGDLK
jgi:hypothetical protein